MKTRILSLALTVLLALLLCSCGDEVGSLSSDETASPGFTELSPETQPQTQPQTDPLELFVSQMTTEEKVGQMFFVDIPFSGDEQLVADYHLGGVIVSGRHIADMTSEAIKRYLARVQDCAKIPLLIGADEEGGTVIRISDNPNVRDEQFLSPKSYYLYGGMDAAIEAETEKAQLLTSLGINVNLAPVCDVTSDPDSFMYDRSFSEDPDETAEFVSKTVEVYGNNHYGSTLKHFPGYGDNVDTHEGMAYDARSLEELEARDLVPFRAGIRAGADAIMVSHNIVEAMDPDYPASLSAPVHTYIRDNMGFTGVIMTDDLVMGAITEYTDSESSAVVAVKCGNDMLCCTDYTTQYPAVVEAVQNGEIPEEQINASVLRILRWKQRLGLI